MYLNLLFSCTFMKKQTAINNKNAISRTLSEIVYI